MFRRNHQFGLVCLLAGWLAMSGCLFLDSAQAQLKPYEGEAQEIKVPGTIADVVMAGNGRYLLLYLKQLRKIAIYDANEVKIVKYLPVGTDEAVIVAGAEKLIVVNKAQNLIERWSLESFERETVRPVPVTGLVKTVSLGYASSGPLMLHWAVGAGALDRASYTLVDLETLKEVPGVEPFRGSDSSYRDYVHIRAAANGRTFGLWATSHSPQGMETMVVEGNRVNVRREHSSAGHICPSANGSYVVTGRGRFSLDLQIGPKERISMPCVPTTHPEFYLAIPAEPGRQHNVGRDPFKGKRATLYLADSNRPVGQIEIGDLGTGEGTSWSRHDFTIDKRVHLIAGANQVVSIPFSNDRLRVKRVSISEELKKNEIEYLYVNSTPATSVPSGKEFRYQLEIESSYSDIAFELSAAPEGMTMTEKGLITWQVPKDADPEVDVIITIEADAGEQVAFHTFRIKIETSESK